MQDLLIYLAAMVVVVPLAKRIGLGAVIGYLVAGALIGPQGFALLSAHKEASQIAEFGVIMMLLLIGLELNPKLLWKMRGPIFGLGGLQVIGTSILFTGILVLFGLAWNVALGVGLILSASSTAIALQTLQEHGYAKSLGGERSFAVLLFQDIAVIPILAILSFLTPQVIADSSANSASPLQKSLLMLGAVASIIASGRFLIRPAFKIASKIKLRETFTALALLIVIAAAVLMHSVGLSPALGAFLAGVVLADSEYKHQIEADIEPFKGLLLGLFFITIGSSIQFQLIIQKPSLIACWVLGMIVLKAILIYGIGRASRMRPPESLLFAISLAQGGEFAFVLLAQASGTLIQTETAQILTASIALSMALAPILISLTIKYGMSRLDCITPEVRSPDAVDESSKDNPVIVIGIGRFGQTLIRFLRANGIAATVLDIDSEQIEIMGKFGIKSYFGDGSNLDLLRAAGLERAKMLIVAVDIPETTTKIVESLRMQYPNLPIYARVFDRLHAYQLLNHGATEVAIETSGSAVSLGTEILRAFGIPEEQALTMAHLFQTNNHRSIRELAKRFKEDDRETFIQASRQMSEQLETLLRTDPEKLLQGASSEWPRKMTTST